MTQQRVSFSTRRPTSAIEITAVPMRCGQRHAIRRASHDRYLCLAFGGRKHVSQSPERRTSIMDAKSRYRHSGLTQAAIGLGHTKPLRSRRRRTAHGSTPPDLTLSPVQSMQRRQVSHFRQHLFGQQLQRAPPRFWMFDVVKTEHQEVPEAADLIVNALDFLGDCCR